MMTIDELAYQSKLSKTTPKAKMAFGVVPLILCLCLNSFAVSITTVLVMGVITVKYAGIPLEKYIRLLSIPFGFLILGTITIVVNRYEPNAALLIGFRLFNHSYGVTPQSLRFGLSIILKAFGAISCMYFISINTPMNDILHVLRALKVPALLISLMELIYRYIFVIMEESHRMRIAQDSRLGYINFKTSIDSLGQLIGTLFLRAYIRSDRIYSALESRGYEGEFKTLSQDYLPAKNMYLHCILFAFILMAMGFWERGVL